MTGILGVVSAGASIGVDSILVRPRRSIGPFVAQVTIEETHDDEMEITDHPVEQGASISDHAYKRPARLRIVCGWSNSPSVRSLGAGIVNGLATTVTGIQSLLSGTAPNQVRDIYEKMVKLQSEATTMDVYTGKRKYSNMLIRGLSTTTTKDHSNMLLLTVTLQQVIIVNTKTVTLGASPSQQADPAATAGPVNAGTQQVTPTNTASPAGGGRGF
jgi:hypothetical protein